MLGWLCRAILHDWPQGAAVRILQVLRAAVPQGREGSTTLLAADLVMSRHPGWLATAMDLQASNTMGKHYHSFG